MIWCPGWFPVSPVDLPCHEFREYGTYLADLDAQGATQVDQFEVRDSLVCLTHEVEASEIEAAEYAIRLAAARVLAAGRDFRLPVPAAIERPDERGEYRETLDEIACDAIYWGARCGAEAYLTAVTGPEGQIGHKLVCSRIWHRWDERAGHLNRGQPELPRNW